MSNPIKKIEEYFSSEFAKWSRRVSKEMQGFLVLLLAGLLSSCAALHHVQIGEVVDHPGFVAKPFEVKFSETGINLDEAKDIAKVFANDKQSEELESLRNFIALFQMGPTTGNPVYVKDYAKNLIQVLYEKCPSGRVTGLTSIRETRKYPVISGEIVKVTGYCLQPKERS